MEHHGFKAITNSGHPYLMEAYLDRDMGQLGALTRLFQCKIEGPTSWRRTAIGTWGNWAH